MSHGISAHQAIISKLKDKAKVLPESAPKQDVEGFQKQYDNLIAAIKVFYLLFLFIYLNLQYFLVLDL